MIHKTCIIHKNAKISKNVKIGPYSVIGENVEISDNGKNLTYIIKRADQKSGEAYAEAEEQPQPKVLEYRGEGIFRDGRSIFIFSKKLDELRIDFGGGYSVLKSK